MIIQSVLNKTDQGYKSNLMKIMPQIFVTIMMAPS